MNGWLETCTIPHVLSNASTSTGLVGPTEIIIKKKNREKKEEEEEENDEGIWHVPTVWHWIKPADDGAFSPNNGNHLLGASAV